MINSITDRMGSLATALQPRVEFALKLPVNAPFIIGMCITTTIQRIIRIITGAYFWNPEQKGANLKEKAISMLKHMLLIPVNFILVIALNILHIYGIFDPQRATTCLIHIREIDTKHSILAYTGNKDSNHSVSKELAFRAEALLSLVTVPFVLIGACISMAIEKIVRIITGAYFWNPEEGDITLKQKTITTLKHTSFLFAIPVVLAAIHVLLLYSIFDPRKGYNSSEELLKFSHDKKVIQPMAVLKREE